MKIALVGGAPSSRMLAPFNDPEWTIWAASTDNMGRLPRVDRWFELHGSLLWPENQAELGPYIDWLNRQDFEVYAQDNSVIKKAIPYPKDDILRMFGVYCFTSTFAWMLALAIREKPECIGVWGIDMASDTEYGQQRPAFQHLLCLAQIRGIRVMVPQESDILCPPPLYGYSESTPEGRKAVVRRKELEGKIALLETEKASIEWHLAFLKGALADHEWHENNYLGHKGELPKVHLVAKSDKPHPTPAAAGA